MTTLALTARRASARRPGLFARLVEMDAAYRQRRALAGLDAARLDDIGLTEADVAREAAKPLWDVPAHWRR